MIKIEKIFNSVIVITDRRVLDDQLQETIYQFEHKQGVVRRIKSVGVKSEQLVTALVEGVPIIIVTIQTFPFVLKAIRESASLKERSFAVIADEAHSSQTGAAARTLKEVLTAEQIEEGEEVSAEDMMVAAMEARKHPPNVSFFAFTATPKPKTIELFWKNRALRFARSISRLQHAAGNRRGIYPRRAQELHTLQTRVQARTRRQGI